VQGWLAPGPKLLEDRLGSDLLGTGERNGGTADGRRGTQALMASEVNVNDLTDEWFAAASPKFRLWLRLGPFPR
jgi:hypothetical protein